MQCVHYVCRPDQGIVFPSVNYMRTRITKAGLQQGRARLPVVIDCKHVNQVTANS